MRILQLRAARGWTLEKTARVFLFDLQTLQIWMRRIDEHGERDLIQTIGPVNRYPDFVRNLVRQLKVLFPAIGAASQRDDDSQSHQGKGTDGRGPRRTSCDSPSSCRGSVSGSHTPRGPHDRTDPRRILGTVVSVLIAAELALLLVGCRGD
jgi:hypothetical protein